MRYRLGALVTALLLMVAAPAFAERVVQEHLPGLREKVALHEFLVKLLIKDLGPFELAFVNLEPAENMGPTLLFEYLLPGDELDNWKRMVTVRVNGIGATPTATSTVLNSMIPIYQKNLKDYDFSHKGGGYLSFMEATQEESGPALYAEYFVGQGGDADAEDVMAVWRQLDRYVIRLMNQKRGGKLTEEDRQATKRVRSQGITIATGPRPGK